MFVADLPLCVYKLYVYNHVHVYAYMCVHIFRLMIFKILFTCVCVFVSVHVCTKALEFATYFFEAGSLPDPGALVFSVRLEASKPHLLSSPP